MVPISIMRTTRSDNTSPPRRRSALRERILTLLRGTGSHPTASWIYGRLRREYPALSLGTVYRNLGILVDLGLVNRIDNGSTFDRYDAKTLPHYHFICEKCHSVTDLDIPVDPALNDRVTAATPLKAVRHEIEFFGLCEKCGHTA
jgi:Fur family peroxide stress response transcriptional regulator